jgi:hypothetical protein
VVDGSSKSVEQFRKTIHFISLGAKITYRNNFSKKNLLGEREVSVCDLSDPIFVFIKDIFKKRQWGELTEEAPTPYIEVVKEFYVNYESFNLDDCSITSTIKGKTLELYKLLEITDPGFSYKGIRASSKTQMRDLFVDPIRPKWCAKSRRMLMNTMFLLTNIWHIGRHTMLTIEKAQFMYAIATDIPIDLASHFIDVIQTTTTEKKVSLSFGGLISRITII